MNFSRWFRRKNEFEQQMSEELRFDLANPVAYVTVSAKLAVVALAACYIPARAMRVDPMTALRYE